MNAWRALPAVIARDSDLKTRIPCWMSGGNRGCLGLISLGWIILRGALCRRGKCDDRSKAQRARRTDRILLSRINREENELKRSGREHAGRRGSVGTKRNRDHICRKETWWLERLRAGLAVGCTKRVRTTLSVSKGFEDGGGGARGDPGEHGTCKGGFYFSILSQVLGGRRGKEAGGWGGATLRAQFAGSC